MVEQEKSVAISNSLYAGKENARLYDTIYTLTETKDIPFWLNIARQLNPKEILEIGVGTGRVAIPLAQAGFKVTGLDIESSMLEVAKEKTAKLPWITRRKLNFIQADARDFNLDHKFDLIISPLNTFCHFLTKGEQIAVLRNMHKNLNPVKGAIVIDTFNALSKASYKWNSSKNGDIPQNRPPLKQYFVFDHKRGLAVRRSVRDYIDSAGDKRKLFVDRESELYDLKKGELLGRSRSVFEAGMLDIMSAFDVLPSAGFDTWNVVGDYDGHPVMDLVPLMTGFEIKGAPSEKIIVIAGPGFKKFKGTPLSAEEAEQIKAERKRKFNGLELIVDGQEMDPKLFKELLDTLV